MILKLFFLGVFFSLGIYFSKIEWLVVLLLDV